MSIGVDREQVSELLTDGFLEPGQCCPAEGNVGYDPEWETKWTEYDVDKAKSLLEGCGLVMGSDGFYKFADGSDLMLTFLAYDGGADESYPVFEQYYKAIGINCALKNLEVSAFDEAIDNNDWVAVMGPHTAIGGASLKDRAAPFVPIAQAAEWYGEYGTYYATKGAQVSGQLKTLSVAIGDKVKKDQLLGVIDPEQAENQIKEVEATLMELRAQRQQAEAELKLARVTYSRQQRLVQTQAVSQQDLDNAATEMAVKQAQIGTIDAQIKRNQASLDTAKTNLDYTRIVAPMAGEVTQITTLQGQTVIAAQQAPNILTLADMSTMLVKAQVSEADVIHLKPGQKAWFTVLGDPLTRYEGQIKDVLPTPEKINDAIFYYARFEVPNPNGLLRLDMTAQVHIQLTDVKNVLTIPLSALGDPVGDNR